MQLVHFRSIPFNERKAVSFDFIITSAMRALQDETLTSVSLQTGPRALLTETRSPEHLDPGHFEALRLALSNLLATDVAEFTYAQIIDGLPTTSSFYDFHSLYDTDDHPAQLHPTLCDGVMDRVYKFRSAFDPLSLKFEPYVSCLLYL